MNGDLKLFKWVIILLALPLGLAIFGGDSFRYPCQDPANWDKDICKPPICEVNRQCPELIFKDNKKLATTPPQTPAVAPKKGECK